MTVSDSSVSFLKLIVSTVRLNFPMIKKAKNRLAIHMKWVSEREGKFTESLIKKSCKAVYYVRIVAVKLI